MKKIIEDKCLWKMRIDNCLAIWIVLPGEVQQYANMWELLQHPGTHIDTGEP